MNMTKVLLIEDDIDIVENLTAYLKEEGFQVKASDGQAKALQMLEENRFDLILLDVTLAEGNGYSACTAIKAKYDLPVIFLTALGDEFSVVTGLDMGADDYISKPFRPRELVSRMRSVLRRAGRSSQTTVIGNLTIDMEKGVVKKQGEEVFFYLVTKPFNIHRQRIVIYILPCNIPYILQKLISRKNLSSVI